jgi:hypothetical protein
MMRSLDRIALVFVAMAASAACLPAQSSASSPQAESPGVTAKEIHPKPLAAPFPLDGPAGRKPALEFRSPEEMTAADRELAEANQGEIARRAGLQGMNLKGDEEELGSWGYEQAVCPVFPQHLILEYSRDNGKGDVTLFSAVIPRGEGHVRVIPVRRRSYSLWTPASSNALTINDFNHLVLEGHEGLSPDWLTLGLCYAALAGGHVRAALVAETPAAEAYPLLEPAMLRVVAKGGAEVRFADATPKTKAMEWVLVFDAQGRLMKVRHVAAAELVKKPVAGAPVEVAGPGR